jgi:hypothetical protein
MKCFNASWPGGFRPTFPDGNDLKPAAYRALKMCRRFWEIRDTMSVMRKIAAGAST